MTRLVVTSDTHFAFDNSLIPDGDVLIHCGDLMYSGYLDEWYGVKTSLAALPHKRKIVIPGNHDFHIQTYLGISRAELRKECGVELLHSGNAMSQIGDLKVLAVPFVTGLPGWAFNLHEEDMRSYLDQYKEADIVISHAPMYKMLDAVHPEQETQEKRLHVGSWELAAWYHRLDKKPSYFFHGHIHESYGEEIHWGTHFVNAAMCDRDYQQVNPAFVIDL